MSLKNSGHFVALDELPNVEGSTTFADAYDQLAGEKNGGGFIVRVRGHEVYVKAAALAEEILRQAIAEVFRGRPLSIEERDALRTKLEQITNKPIEEIVEQSIRATAVVAVHQEPILVTAAEEELQNQHDRVFDIQEDGRRIGWHLNHEEVRSTTTEKPSYTCSNPTDPHTNASFDHGKCGQCPWALLK